MIDVVERLETGYATDRSDFESAIESLVDFDTDTTELDEQVDEIRGRMQQVARQHQRMAEDRQGQ